MALKGGGGSCSAATRTIVAAHGAARGECERDGAAAVRDGALGKQRRGEQQQRAERAAPDRGPRRERAAGQRVRERRRDRGEQAGGRHHQQPEADQQAAARPVAARAPERHTADQRQHDRARGLELALTKIVELDHRPLRACDQHRQRGRQGRRHDDGQGGGRPAIGCAACARHTPTVRHSQPRVNRAFVGGVSDLSPQRPHCGHTPGARRGGLSIGPGSTVARERRVISAERG